MNRLKTVTPPYPSRQKRPNFNFKSFIYQQPLSLASILQVLRELKPLQQVHAHVVTSGLSHNIFLSNRLMNQYASCGLMADADKIFSKILNKNLVSWTILISGFIKNSIFIDAINVFRSMMICGFVPNAVTITSILPAFGNLGLTQMGKSVHCFWIRQGFEGNVFVETALVDMYSKFGCMAVARKLFDGMSERNVVSWNAIISGYSGNRNGEETFRLSILMQRIGFSLDSFTIVSMISASSNIDYVQIGPGVHGLTIRNGFEKDQLVQTALMDMYVRSSCIDDAYSIFNGMPVKDVVAWTLMLTGFSDGQYWNKAIEHFNKMMEVEGLALDSVALMGILSSCSSSGALQLGMRVHSLVVKTGFESYFFVGSAIIDMYANCGNLEGAKRCFLGMSEKDVVCWNAMISAYGMNGYGNDAIDLFLKMKGSGINPDDSTFVCVLCACSHAGIVDEGLHIFNHMVKRWNVIPKSKHYACVIDLLCRAGQLDEADSLINNMQLKPEFEVYTALLSACRVHSNAELGIKISQKLLELRPNDAGNLVLISNMYNLAGNQEGLQVAQLLSRSEGLRKEAGFSLIEIT